MVLPDRPGESESITARPRTLVAVMGGAALIVGFGVLAALTSPEPEAGSTTTKSVRPDPTFDVDRFTVADIVRGPDLEWRLTLTVEDRYVNGLLSHDDGALLYASGLPRWLTGEGSIEAWSSLSGVEWRPHGEVIQGVTGGTLASDGRSVMMVASGWDMPSLLLTSDDGIAWRSERVPTEPEPGHAVFLTAGAIGQQSRVVAGSTYFDTQGILRRYLADVHQIQIGEFHHQWESRGDDVVYIIQGPIGIPILEVTGSELGFDEDEMALATGGGDGPPGGVAWVDFGDQGWSATEIPDLQWLNTILVAPDGTFVAHGWSTRGSTIWRSLDGIDWVKAEVMGVTPESIVRWRDELAGAQLHGLPSLLRSLDGDTWDRTSLEGILPRGMRWGFEHLEGGDGGLGIVVSSWDGLRSEGPREPLVVEDGDVTFVFDFSAGTVRLLTPVREQSFATYSAVPAWVQPDLAGESVGFLDETSGELLAKLSFEELRQAESDYWSTPSAAAPHTGLMFSPDGSEWWIDDFREDVGEDAVVVDMAITSDSIFLATVDLDFYLSAPSTPGFEIWTASLP